MADRSSARLIGGMLEILAKERDLVNARRIARKVYDLGCGYDFTADQMDAEEACLRLGLAKHRGRGESREVVYRGEE